MGIILTIILIILVWKIDAIKQFFGTDRDTKNLYVNRNKNTNNIDNPTPEEKLPIYMKEGITTNFRDTLKANTRTKEEVEREHQEKEMYKINKDVQETISMIKSEILMKAQNGDYVTVDDKKIITLTSYLPTYYYKIRVIEPTYAKVRKRIFDSPQPAIEDMNSHLKALMQLSPDERKRYNLVQQTRKKNIFEPQDATAYETFTEQLISLAASEGILVKPIIINSKTETEYRIPCEISGNIDWMDYSLVAKCVCDIPEKYSSDIPITADFNNGLESDIINDETESKSINIDDMDGHCFEYFCSEILSKNGFTNVEVTRGSGDQGIDIIATKDGIKYGIQCKCYSTDIGNSAVQEAFAGKTFYKCHVGAVLTNRYFTRSAKNLAETSGVLLWDRTHLLKLVKKANIKVI